MVVIVFTSQPDMNVQGSIVFKSPKPNLVQTSLESKITPSMCYTFFVSNDIRVYPIHMGEGIQNRMYIIELMSARSR